MLVCDIMVLSNPPPGYEVPDSAFNASTVYPYHQCEVSNARWSEDARANDENSWCACEYPDGRGGGGNSKTRIWDEVVKSSIAILH